MLALFIIAAFPDVIFGGRTFFYRDFGIFGYPLAFHHRESFWNGEVPLWNPLSNCGLPFLAQWNTMVLYPLSLFYVMFPLSWSLGVFCLVHLFLAGLGMYHLGHRWTGSRLAASVAGLAFAFNGLTLSCLKWPNNIAALAWMPFVVWRVECGWRTGSRQIVVAAVVGALQMLTGGPEIILFTWGFVAVLWVVQFFAEKAARGLLVIRFLTIVVLVAGLASAQLLPFLDLLVHSQRDLAYGDAYWSMPAWGWANFVVPLFRCFPSHQGVFAQAGQYWVSSYYVGIGVSALAMLTVCLYARRSSSSEKLRASLDGGSVSLELSTSKRVWLLAWIIAVSLVLALGETGLVYKWLRQCFPALQVVRFPVKFVVLVVFAIPLLCAFGVARLPGGLAHRRLSNLRLLLILGVGLLAVIAAVLWVAWKYPLPTDQWPATWQSGLSRAALLAMVLTVAGALGRFTRQKSQILLGWSLLFLIVVDALTHAPRLNPTIERWVYEPGLTKAELRLTPEPKMGKSRAMLSPFADFRLNHLALTNAVNDYLYSRMSLFANANILDQIPKVDGFFSLYLREESQVRSLLYASTNASFPSLANFLGVSQLTAPDKLIEWTSQPGYFPFATGGQKPIFSDPQAMLRGISDTTFDPAHVVYLPVEARNRVSVADATKATVTVSRFSAHRIDLDVDAAQAAWVVLAQSYYHPWRAYVGGKSAPLTRANNSVQAFEVPAGRSVVKVVYEDQPFHRGAVLSGLTSVICVWLWFLFKRREKLRSSTQSTAMEFD